MNEKQETVADVVAEMLAAADANERGGDYSMATDAVRAYAERIAWAKQEAAIGNAAAVRNCDRFKTEKEARKAFYKVYFGPTESEYVDEAFINWLFSTAEEGGAE